MEPIYISVGLNRPEKTILFLAVGKDLCTVRTNTEARIKEAGCETFEILELTDGKKLRSNAALYLAENGFVGAEITANVKAMIDSIHSELLAKKPR